MKSIADFLELFATSMPALCQRFQTGVIAFFERAECLNCLNSQRAEAEIGEIHTAGKKNSNSNAERCCRFNGMLLVTLCPPVETFMVSERRRSWLVEQA
jgi:hypothetical protein